MRQTRITRLCERIVMATIVVASCLIAPVSAAEISVAGFTNGCFGAACMPPDTSASQTTSFPDPAGLVFVNATFSGMTSGGTLDLNGAPSFPSQGTNNLGSFFLGTFPFNYNGQTFTLRTSFTSPSSIADVLVTATLSETASGLTVDFPAAPLLIPSLDGAFTLTVNDVIGLLRNGADLPITGRIAVVSPPDNNVVPEPSTLALLAIAAVGVVRRLARRASSVVNTGGG